MSQTLTEFKRDFLRRYRHTTSQPFLVQVVEKGWERYFYCENYDMLERIALKLVTARVENGTITYFKTASRPPVDEAVVIGWPECQLRRISLDQWETFRRREKEDEERMTVVDAAKTAVREQSGLMALWVIEQRQRCEYERVNYEVFEQIEGV